MAAKDFITEESTFPLSDTDIKKIKKSKFNGIVIIETTDDNIPAMKDLLDTLNANSAHIIIAGNLNQNSKSFLIDNSVSDIITSGNAEQVIDYIKAFTQNNNTNMGSILIFDDSESRTKILKNIIQRFNYKPVISSETDEFFNNLNNNIEIALINIATKNFHIKNFTKKINSSVDFKKTPLIPYKNMNEGIFIHETMSGIHRIAKVILSVEELYSFLIDILFRKKLFPALHSLNTKPGYDNILQFSHDPLQKIYKCMGPDIFTLDNMIGNEEYDKWKYLIKSVENIFLRIDGLRWLLKDNNHVQISKY